MDGLEKGKNYSARVYVMDNPYSDDWGVNVGTVVAGVTSTYFFLPTFAVTLAFPILIAVNNTLFFVFLLSLTIFFLSTHHLTFFLLFFRFNLKLFPLTRVTFFLFSSTFFPFDCNHRESGAAKGEGIGIDFS